VKPRFRTRSLLERSDRWLSPPVRVLKPCTSQGSSWRVAV
jgi:hypothetical protein